VQFRQIRALPRSLRIFGASVAGDAGGLTGIGKYWLSEPKIAIRAMLRTLRYDGTRADGNDAKNG
jgi:hypothetical protein